MADITRSLSDPQTYTLTITSTEAVVLLLGVSVAQRLTGIPRFVVAVAEGIDGALRPVVAPPGTLIGEFYELLTPAERPALETDHGR